MIPDSPRRGILREAAADRMAFVAEKWRSTGNREGNTPIPIGGVVTVASDKVDRGHTDDRRLIGVVVEDKIREDKHFYKVNNILLSLTIGLTTNLPAIDYTGRRTWRSTYK